MSEPNAISGLSSDEAARRLAAAGPNELAPSRGRSRLRLLAEQVRSPLLALLIFAAAVSALGGEWTDAGVVFAIIAVTVGVGYHREARAETAIAALLERVRATCTVVRDGAPRRVPVAEVVPGDVVVLAAGSVVPGDGVLLETTDFFVNEAVLTGESFPVEKRDGGHVFLGTSVRSGTARARVEATGGGTRFAAIARRLTLRPPETEFERGIRHFGTLLLVVMVVMVLVVFAANVLLGRAPIDTLLFSIALAVGLSPELLPAILSINLAAGAQALARAGVLVRRLNAIENLGSMDTLCTDKTGTLTEGVARVEGAYDADGRASAEVMALATLNAALQAGLPNPLDRALVEAAPPPVDGVEKVGEIPYDFVRKRLSVVVRDAGGTSLVTKGAFAQVLEVCATAGGAPLDDARRAALRALHEGWSAAGIRVLAVATRDVGGLASVGRGDERELAFRGFVTFVDPPKAGAAAAIAELTRLGVAVKMVTGDAKLVAQHIAGALGLRADRVLTGHDLDELRDEALWQRAEGTDLFVEVDPNQKERILLALKKTGHVVGFLGDGINDAPAMHGADVSLSVEGAVDVAREAADMVLLEKRLDVIQRGIEEGRRTFANTLKYVLTTTSANLGNMASMAVASAFLPFLPLTAGQVLLNNFLSDIPAIGIAGDSVDPELVERPRRWDMRFIGRFMVEFGLLSSIFDLATFAVLLLVFHAAAGEFRTGWFVESLLTELAIALVVRTRRVSWRSRPGRVLVWTTVAVTAVTLAIPFAPGAAIFGFVPPPAGLLAAVLAITIAYVASAELLKRWFYRPASGAPASPRSPALRR